MKENAVVVLHLRPSQEPCLPMAHTDVAVFLPRHLQKYLLKKLDPASAHGTPKVAEVQLLFLELMGVRVSAPTDTARMTLHRVRIHQFDGKPLNKEKSRRLSYLLDQLWKEEFVKQMDRWVYDMGMEKQKAADMFRALYSVEDEDLSLAAVLDAYKRYERKMGRRLRKGGARQRSGPAPQSPRYKRRRARLNGTGL